MKNKKYIQLVALIISVLVLVFVVWLIVKLSSGTQPSASAPQGQSASPIGALPSSAPTPSSPTAIPAPAGSKITIVAPVLNDQWIIGKQNIIQWSRAAGAPDGTITLINASTGAVVGWIQQHIASGQATFPWNTGSVYISRTSSLSKNVPTGNYRIVLTFNSPSIPAVTGPVFTIISAAEAQIPTASITIQGTAFSPSSISVAQGTKLVFTNRDAKTYEFSVTSSGTFTVGAGASQTFDTAILTPGAYVFYSTAYPSLRLTVTVENKTP